jgi:hypothetical protein
MKVPAVLHFVKVPCGSAENTRVISRLWKSKSKVGSGFPLNRAPELIHEFARRPAL